MYDHTGKTVTCPHCNKEVKNPRCLEYHIKVYHPKPQVAKEEEKIVEKMHASAQTQMSIGNFDKMLTCQFCPVKRPTVFPPNRHYSFYKHTLTHK